MTKRDHGRVPPHPDAAAGAGGGASEAPRPDATPPPGGADPARDAPTTAGEDELARDVAGAASLASLQAQLDQERDRSLRAQAELENFRKRMMRSFEEERRYAVLPLARDLLPVIDNLHRAIAAGEQHAADAGLLEGVKLVATQLATILDQHHCMPIPAEPGSPFDPHLHHAELHYPTTEYPSGQIFQVLQTGYQLHDRVVRPTQVIVAAPAPGAGSASARREAATDATGPEVAPPDPNANT